jgi:citrate synthase
MAEQTRVPKGLAGVAVTETSISKSSPDGKLVYRGYPIEVLAEKSNFEEVAFLILFGYLPKKYELDNFSSKLNEEMTPDERVLSLMRLFPPDSNPMDVIRTAVSFLGSLDKEDSLESKQVSIAAKMAAIVPNSYRALRGNEFIKPRKELSYAENFLYMLTSKIPEKEDAWIFERELIFYMEHDLNASSFTVRVVASTLSDPYSSVTAGLSALKGPLHGGANEEVMKYILKIKPEEAEGFVREELQKGRKIMGFGHRVYKKFDPRAVLSKRYLEMLSKRKEKGETVYRVCDSLEKAVWSQKQIPPNLDFYAAPIFYLLDIPTPLYTPIFAASRVFGWLAHYREQIEDNKLFRPDAIYTGKKDLKYLPVELR